MKRGGPDHPKTQHLAIALDIPMAYATGLVERLAHFAYRYAPQGDVGRWPNATIARNVDPQGLDADRLVEALHGVGYLDECCLAHRLVVHDWTDHADESCRKSLRKQNLTIVKPGHPEPPSGPFSNGSRPGRDAIENHSPKHRSASGKERKGVVTENLETAARARARVDGARFDVEPRVRDLVETWSRRFGGDPPMRQLRDAVDELRQQGHELGTIAAHWRVYLDPKLNPNEARFLSPRAFASKFNTYAPKRRREPYRAPDPPTPADVEGVRAGLRETIATLTRQRRASA